MALLRRAGPIVTALWTPDQLRTTPPKSGALRSIRGTPLQHFAPRPAIR
jgi:hypothetical protein